MKDIEIDKEKPMVSFKRDRQFTEWELGVTKKHEMHGNLRNTNEINDAILFRHMSH